jgi:hypothetical protein
MISFEVFIVCKNFTLYTWQALLLLSFIDLLLVVNCLFYVIYDGLSFVLMLAAFISLRLYCTLVDHVLILFAKCSNFTLKRMKSRVYFLLYIEGSIALFLMIAVSYCDFWTKDVLGIGNFDFPNDFLSKSVDLNVFRCSSWWIFNSFIFLYYFVFSLRLMKFQNFKKTENYKQNNLFVLFFKVKTNRKYIKCIKPTIFLIHPQSKVSLKIYWIK